MATKTQARAPGGAPKKESQKSVLFLEIGMGGPQGENARGKPSFSLRSNRLDMDYKCTRQRHLKALVSSHLEQPINHTKKS